MSKNFKADALHSGYIVGFCGRAYLIEKLSNMKLVHNREQCLQLPAVFH